MSKLTTIITLGFVLAISFAVGAWINLSDDDFIVPTTSVKTKIIAPSDQEVSANGISISFLEFDDSVIEELHILISGTYGTTILKPEPADADWKFKIPALISKRAGRVEWSLLLQTKTIQKGSFQLVPKTTSLGLLENYLGPRSIVANERDYTMLVSIPTDSLDNMLPDGTSLSLNHQFKNKITRTPVELNKGFAWQRIYAPRSTGRVSTGSTLATSNSKELVVDVFPDTAIDFELNIDQNHTYADGNELTTLSTSQIKDQQGNVMTDGTLVTFYMKDESGSQWQTTASTVNGFAFAKAIHPQHPTSWTINAVIQGIAQSPVVDLDFKSILTEIPVRIENRTVIVGALTSYLGQIIPDGIQVSIEVDQQDFILFTQDGRVTMTLDPANFPKSDYFIKVKTLGLTTVTKITALEEE